MLLWIIWSILWATFTHEPKSRTMKLWEPKRKCPNAVVPAHLQKHESCSLVTDARVYCEFICNRAFNQMLLSMNYFYSCGSSHMIKQDKSIVVNVHCVMVSRFCENSPSDHETWSIRCHYVGIHVVDFMTILHSHTYSVGPSSVVWSELGPAPPFPPIRVLEVVWSWALSLVCEVAL